MNTAIKLLDEVNGVNFFKEVNELKLIQGNPYTLYFRLIQESSDINYLRYIPASGATVEVNFTHIDNSKKIARIATQPFADDKSVFSVQILATDSISFESMTAKLTEGASTKTLLLNGSLTQQPIGNNKAFC